MIALPRSVLRYRSALLALGLLLPAALLLAAGIGAYYIPPWEIPRVLLEKADQAYAVLVSIRFPRVVLAAAVGALLALSGAVLQGLFRNPLADPGLIGVTSGAGLGAAIFIVLVPGAGALQVFALPLMAFVGGLLTTLLVWRLASSGGRVQVLTLLLAGIALNAAAGALIGLLISRATDEQLRSLTFWTLGGYGGATWTTLLAMAPTGLVALWGLLRLGRPLNALVLGEREAFHLGVNLEPFKRQAVALSALAVGTAVAAAGGVGFIGLVAPHLFRLLAGPDHRYLLPGATLLGASLSVLADLVARTAVAPAELPVGVVTSLLGAPFFIWLLLRHKREVAR
ncbi:MAG: iron ABC transporter permease [Meiothermus sp.]|uniref:FecCD family ABC transporter permease n=1 Tax=Meiothermus sp. TaxID=1955249 RepID=UPI0025E1F940|nr:iron ABC transporter permease [Meiothermus sp.]MCS7193672.1 iron ABC transporter permease [Meiothermus sp.]MDW8091310.1 iron ABC transporter permease [Meiothermus sp.]MDW8481572.1 iron ABC transporter permease [Meiothermus sp.]